MTGRLLATFAALLVTTSCASAPPVPPSPAAPSGSPAPTSTGSTLTPRPSPAPKPVRPARPLAGVTIALDPGHQLGNHNFPAETGRIVEAGGLRKPCNTTGTATADGWPEATFAFEVGRVVARRLEALGARVELTRSVNSEDRWGPCVDVRGRFARRVGADLLVSLHADGAPEGEHGFHVIAPPGRAPSLRLAEALRAGLVEHRIPRSTYVADGLAVRADLGTLNLAGVPAAMLELGNMRNAEDARRMRSAEGQALYAAGVVRGIRRYLHR